MTGRPIHLLSRRGFVAGSVAALAPAALRLRQPRWLDELDQFIDAEMTTALIPGLAAVIVKDGRIAWSRGYGWADISGRRRMDPVRTIQNIGSISKTITATAVMQQVERNRIGLDDDVNRLLPFPVRHPAHPDVPITPRLLLTHRSGIVDGEAYMASYACGDPTTALGDWLRDYLAPDGRFFRADGNFGDRPGTTWKYSNIGFGLLGHLVERTSGLPFPAYTRQHIFEPLGLRNTGWLWADIDPATHAVNYEPITEATRQDLEGFRRLGFATKPPERHPTLGDFQPLCGYNFVTYPDGGLRISATGLARFLLANMGTGDPILRSATLATIRTPLSGAGGAEGQGLAWHSARREGEAIRWGHNGADPGVRTNMWFRPSDGVGAIVFVNRSGVNLDRFIDRMLAAASRL